MQQVIPPHQFKNFVSSFQFSENALETNDATDSATFAAFPTPILVQERN